MHLRRAGLIVAAGSAMCSLLYSTAGASAAGSAPATGDQREIPRQAVSEGTGTIRGRVYTLDSRPLARAQVRAFSMSSDSNVQIAMTDADGRYIFERLVGGDYLVAAAKRGYVMMSLGQVRPGDQPKPITVTNATVHEVNLRLPPGAVIVGRVLDEFGEPAPDIEVSLLRFELRNGRGRLVRAMRAVTTNDLGEYRAFGLAPGSYYVSVRPSPASLLVGKSADQLGYSAVYYPGTANTGDAKAVVARLGQHLSGIDVALMPVRMATISGVISDSAGRPLTTGAVRVTPEGPLGSAMEVSSRLRPDGSFATQPMPPGNYSLTVEDPQRDPSADWVTGRVTLAGMDVTDVHLVGAKPAILRGRIRLAGIAGQAARPVRVARVFSSSALEHDNSPEVSAAVETDLTFKLFVPPGRRIIGVQIAEPQWALQTIRLNGRDITDSGLELKAQAEVGGIEIEITDRPTVLQGQVKERQGDLAADCVVIVFAQDRQRWPSPTRYTRWTRLTEKGDFRLVGLPAGDYYVAALDYLDPSMTTTTAETLERLAQAAVKVSLRDGEATSLMLAPVQAQ